MGIIGIKESLKNRDITDKVSSGGEDGDELFQYASHNFNPVMSVQHPLGQDIDKTVVKHIKIVMTPSTVSPEKLGFPVQFC